jgi:hypothetical protein
LESSGKLLNPGELGNIRRSISVGIATNTGCADRVEITPAASPFVVKLSRFYFVYLACLVEGNQGFLQYGIAINTDGSTTARRA